MCVILHLKTGYFSCVSVIVNGLFANTSLQIPIVFFCTLVHRFALSDLFLEKSVFTVSDFERFFQ